MKRRGSAIPARKPVFLGCEGESEQAYGQFLNDLAREQDVPFHLEVVNLNPGAGDPLALVRRAAQEIARRSSRRSAFGYRTLLIDSDRIDHDAKRRRLVEHEAAELRIHIIWQQPCHEAFLLRHFSGYGDHQPPSASAAIQRLRQAWPEYRKAMPRLQLKKRLSLEAVLRASSSVHGLAALLQWIRLKG